MADAVLDVEVRARLESLSSGLAKGQKSIGDFVNAGDRNLSKIESRFASLGKTTKEIANNINSALGGISLDQYFKNIHSGSAVIEKSKVEVQKLKEEVERLRAVSQGLTNQIKEKTKALNDSKNATEQSRLATENQRRATEAERTANEAARKEITLLTLEKKKNQQQIIAASGSYREAQQRLTALGKSIREAGGGFDATNLKVRAQINEYSKLNRKLKEFDAQMGNHQRNVGNYGSALAGSIPFLGQFTSIAGLAAAGVSGLQKSFNQNMTIDAFKTALREISGDAKEFNINLEFLRSTADRLGLDFLGTANSFKQWQGAAKFSNLTAAESRRIFESVANAGAKMKLTNDQIQGSFLALSQMLSKGKVQAEELRGQLGERLPGAFALAAKAMGVTEKELNKMLEKGEVIANDFLPKFADQLDKSFSNDKTKKIESMQAEVNRLKTAWDRLFESDNALAFFTEVSKGLANTVAEFDKTINSKSWKEFFLRLGGNASTGITATLMGAAADSQRYKNTVPPFDRAVQRNVKGFSDLSNEQKKLKIQEQTAVLTRQINDYRERGDKESLDRVKYHNAILSEMNKLYYTQLNTKKNIKVVDNEVSKAETKTIDKRIDEQKKLQEILADSNSRLVALTLNGTQKEIQSINDRHNALKRRALENVKVASDAAETIALIEKNRIAEVENFGISVMKSSIAKRLKNEKELNNKIATDKLKILEKNVDVELTFSKKFDESATQKSMRLLNDKYRTLANNLNKELKGQISLGVNVDQDNRQQALQDEYFQKAEEVYRNEQKMRVDMVDSRNLFNTSLEKTNVLLDDNTRKFQAGAISAEQFQKVQKTLLNEQENLNALKGTYDNFTNGVTSAFSNMLTDTESFADGMENVVKNLVSSLLQQATRLAVVKLFGSIFTGGASLLLPGFSRGGYTGNKAKNEIAGVTHGQEFVFDANSTKRLGVDNLRALQKGNIPSVSDFTPRITKNNSNFIPTAQNGNERLSIDLNIRGEQRNTTTKYAVDKAVRVNRKFGRG
jgi:tape measure domain-containing protein